MKVFIVMSILLSVSVLHAQSNQFSASHIKAAEKLLETMDTEKTLKSSISEMLDIQSKENPLFQKNRKELEAFFNKYISYKNLKDEYIKMYVEVYNEQEIIELTAFYNTPILAYSL